MQRTRLRKIRGNRATHLVNGYAQRVTRRSLFASTLLALALVGDTAAAHAHGGTPYSLKIMRSPGSTTLYMPSYWWGVWVGSTDVATNPSAPWHFICEEAINTYRDRRFALSNDGALYATSQAGVTVARQNGCAWIGSTANTAGELATLASTGIAVDPVDGTTAWVATGTNATVTGTNRVPAHNGVFVTHDHGDHFARVPGIGGAAGDTSDPTYGRTYDSVVVAPSDGKTLYLSSTNYKGTFDVAVHKTTDAGVTFTTVPMPTLPGHGAVFSLQLMAVDPRDATVVYARATMAAAEGTQLFLRGVFSSSGLVFTELASIAIPSPNHFDWSKGINDLSFDLKRDQLLVATGKGLLRGSAALTSQASDFAAGDDLSQTQCVFFDADNDRVFACGGTYGPDFAALACDSSTSPALRSIFQFEQTVGPIDCPAGTQVAMLCPPIWATYQSELNPGNPVVSDGGVPADGGVLTTSGGGCSVSGKGAPGPWALIALAMLAAFAYRRTASRRRG